MKRLLFLSLICSTLFSANLLAQMVSKFKPAYGLKYVISLKNDPTKVLAHYGAATNCVVESYVVGNPNQLFYLSNIGPGAEDWVNFRNLTTGSTFNYNGLMMATNNNQNAYSGWDLEKDATGAIRFSSFLNRWSYDQGVVNGSFLKYNSVNNSVELATYNRWTNGVLDLTGYNAHATDFFDFKFTPVYDVSANTSAVTASRMILESGKTYIICLKENVNKVVAFNATGQKATIEDYVSGKTNQQFTLQSWSNNTEDFVNFKDMANTLSWENSGNTGPSTTNNAWQGWDLQLNATGGVRFCHFLERWGWAATYGIDGAFLRVSDDKTTVVSVPYNKSLAAGTTRDYTAYNAKAGMYYDFMIKTPADYVSTVVKTENVKNSSAFGGQQTIVFNNVSNTNINIYSVDGRLIKNVKPNAETMQVRISKGIYLVNIDNRTSKVVVQ